MVAGRECNALASASSGTHAVVVVGITVCAATPGSLRSRLALAMPGMEKWHVTHNSQRE
jgi:hypothetical protein